MCASLLMILMSVSISWSPPVYSNHAFLQGLEPDASEEALCFCEAERFGQVVSL